jgi:predicted dehydrogenase
MIKLAVVGLGKMGVSHLSMINAHPDVNLVAVCDTAGYMLDVLGKYTGMTTYTDFGKMLNEVEMDAMIIATPSTFHADMVRKAMEKGIAVFCEKPFTLDHNESVVLAELAESKKLVNQVGYHYRFVGAFQEVKRLLDTKAIGEVTHVLAEAYGPVVLKPKGSSWRSQRNSGGGCLYDYAAHPINLLNWYFGVPEAVGGTVLNSIFSTETDDEVFSTLMFPEGPSAQLSVNWSDESQRKMSTKLTFWGTKGRIYADRQEVQVYLRDTADAIPGYGKGWNVRYTTELTEPVWFYLRGEEYSAQLDYFVKAVEAKAEVNINSFKSAAETDAVIDMLIADQQSDGSAKPLKATVKKPAKRRFFSFGK